MTVAAGVPSWATPSTGMTNPMTTTGDTIYSSSGSTPARLGIGSTGNVLTVAGGVPTWSAPAGSPIKQIVETQKGTAFATTSTSPVDVTGLSATITPSSASSKILVMVNVPIGYLTYAGTATSYYAWFGLLRGATTLTSGYNKGLEAMASTSNPYVYFNETIMWVDSPATTSATTYQLQYNTSNSNVTVQATRSSIILMEI